MKRHLLVLALVASSLAAQGVSNLPAPDKLGMGKMWTFENLPTEYFESTYGFVPGQEWLDHVRMASLRFGGGCSASFVSPNGLIMTNHHCVRDFIAKASPSDADWVRDGYTAASGETEVKLDGCDVEQLVSMKDVTKMVMEGVSENDDPAAINAKKRDNRRQIRLQAESEHEGLKAQVVTLYQGAQEMLYLYKVWDDVRLVVAPHLQTAHFGGDPDNFTYPRWGIDFSFCRAYENDEPVDSSEFYFKWCKEGVKENDLVFVTGNPGSTGRLKTKAQLEYLRDVQYPQVLSFIDSQVAAMKEAIKKNPDRKKDILPELLRMQNGQKNYRGTLDGLRSDSLMDQKANAEKALRRHVQSDSKLAADFLASWENIERLTLKQQKAAAYQPAGLDSLLAAVFISRVTDPDAPRATVRRLSQQLDRLIEVGIDDSSPEKQAEFVARLKKAEAALGKDDPFLETMRVDGSYEKGVAKIVSETKLTSGEGMKALLDGGAEAVKSSTDPAVIAGRTLLPLLLEAQKGGQDIETEMKVHEAKIGRLYYEVFGNKVAADATFTLRLSDGVVKGYPCNGTIAPYRTTFWSLYGRCLEFGNVYPFDLPDIWIQRKNRVDLDKAVCFCSTNDIIGGNSGSPVINQNKEIVGLVFDGNIESLPNNYVFRDDVPRAVSVHTDAIMEALTKIYEAQRVADELLGK